VSATVTVGQTVYWEEDPSRKRRVKSGCRNCLRSWLGDEFSLVSPTGVAHSQHFDYHEKTACGLDATGEDWWWPL
jgi:hypothetical protein